MNILYIDHYAGGPALGMEYRPYYLAREWVKNGHRVTIVAATFSHVRAKQPPVHSERRGAMEMIDGIRYHWIYTPQYKRNGFGRLYNIFTFLRRLWSTAVKIAREVSPQVVIASSTYPLDIWVARKIARKANAKLVFELHDLWPMSLVQVGGMPAWHPFVWLCSRAQRATVKYSDALVSILPNVGSHYDTLGLSRKRLHVIPNGVALDEWRGDYVPAPDSIMELIHRARREGRLVVCYLGSHGRPNALEFFLEAAVGMANEPVDFLLIGDGMEKRSLQAKYTGENIHYLPPVQKAQVRTVLSEVDVAYIGWRNIPLYKYGIAPNKLLDYMMAGCPVLHATNCDNDPVELAKCGFRVEAEDVEGIKGAVRRFAKMSSDERHRLGENGRKHILENHVYAVLAERFLKAIEQSA